MKYVAELAHVREVSLLGSADLGFWAERLRVEGLTPVEHAGLARVLVVACDSKFFGVRFRELSFSVFVRRPDVSEGSDAAFLVQAFNSSRFFAWSERTWFSTPYRHGVIDVDVGLPAAMRLGLEGQTVFSAVMSADSNTQTREPSRSGGSRVGPAALRRAGPPDDNVIDDGGPALEASLSHTTGREPSRSGIGGFAGPVFLPGNTRGKGTSRRLFFAKVEGETQAYPFLSTDTLTLRPSAGSPILQALIDSHFVVDEWLIRRDAVHAKSKTFRRMDGQDCSSYKP